MEYEDYDLLNILVLGQTSKTKQRLEQSCCKKRQKSPEQENGLWIRKRLKVLNDTKLVLNEHE